MKTFLLPKKISDFLGPKKQSFLRRQVLSNSSLYERDLGEKEKTLEKNERGGWQVK